MLTINCKNQSRTTDR